MTKPVVFMFSGQGSHYYHMGEELYDNLPEFKERIDAFNAVAADVFERSIVAEIYDSAKKKGDNFDHTHITTPAILMVEYALATLLMDSGIRPDYIIGSSLGEVTGLLVAGVRDIKGLLAGTRKRLDLFAEKCEIGRMVGILDHVSVYEKSAFLREKSEIAAINFDAHFVITCRDSDLAGIETYLDKHNIVYQTLAVSQGFHSSLLDPAEQAYKRTLSGVKWQPTEIPIISCASAQEVTQFDADYLWQAFRQPILFQKTIQAVETRHNCIYIDLGPSGTLANFTKHNLKRDSKSTIFSILTPFGQDTANLATVREFFKHHNQAKQKKVRKMTTKMKTYVFPGQGSQTKGMGGDLFDEFKDLTKSANELLGYSIKQLCLKDPKKRLNQTQFTQPALYVVNALSYLKHRENAKTLPDFVAGHSLGEYNALFAAGAIDFETGLTLVKKRGELMSKAAGGGMAAVLGLTEEKIAQVLTENNLETIDIANYNTPSQIVISGPKKDIVTAEPIFKKAGAHYITLNVSAAFHSRYMQAARDQFEKYLSSFKFSKLLIPVISNVHARPYRQDAIVENLANQLRSSVKWTESIRFLMGKGEMVFEEIGHGNVLTKMIKAIQKSATPLSVSEKKQQASFVPETKDRVTAQNQTVPKTPPPRPPAQNPGPETAAAETKENTIEPAPERSIPKVAERQLHSDVKYPQITSISLGSDLFKNTYNLKYAYVSGAMVRGIASKEMVVKMGKAGMLGFFGAGGLTIDELEAAITDIKRELNNGQAYGINLLNSPLENDTVDLLLKHNVRLAEAAAYLQITAPLVKYRLKGLHQGKNGSIEAVNRIMAKVSRPEVATGFLSPAPQKIVKKLLEENAITQNEAELSHKIPMADEICIEADSGGHTDGGVAYALMPAMLKLRDEMKAKHQYSHVVSIGAAGGIGTPEAAAAAFMLGADFILTGSINQCTVEAGISDIVKDLLQDINVQDTEYAPAGDMFEMGAKIQVLRKGVFFPARANKLYDLYRHYNSIDEIDEKTKKQLQERYFKRSFEEIYEDVKAYWPKDVIEHAEQNPKHKMALIFRWYFGYSNQLALNGVTENKVDFQVHCGPALGAFNQWVKSTDLHNWRNRYVDQIAEMLMQETAKLLNQRFQAFMEKVNPN